MKARITPEVLKWARERAGFTVGELADISGRKLEQIISWEEGSDVPTYVQLEELAYKFLKVPLAVFFFPEPPEEIDIKESFRTVPFIELEQFNSDTLYALRIAQARQLSLYELQNGRNPSDKQIFKELHCSVDDNPVDIARIVRDYIGVSLKEQCSWRTTRDAINKWREAIEEAGVYVFKRPFKQEGVSGFSLIDREFPVIYINNSDVKSRQIFTLFHELAHILFNEYGITKKDEYYIDYLEGKFKQIEVLSNRFAGEFLVPTYDFIPRIKGVSIDDNMLNSFANYYNVSRVVILRRLLNLDFITSQYYADKINEWEKGYLDGVDESGSTGGDYYRNTVTYLGYKYSELVLKKYYEHRISKNEVADYLDIKVSSISGLELLLSNHNLNII